MKRLGLLCAALLLSGCTVLRGALPIISPTQPPPAPGPVTSVHRLSLTNGTAGTYHLAVALIEGASRVTPSQGVCTAFLGLTTCFLGDVPPGGVVTLDVEGVEVSGGATWGTDDGHVDGTRLE